MYFMMSRRRALMFASFSWSARSHYDVGNYKGGGGGAPRVAHQ